ncbi:hypothetical protein C1706_02010 [Propioniciclava flava]|uniref:Uncharacterized protein n=1 Tax=Propioniciclava flava TaxID=2072026 RepID=A0A4Q2EIX1_9ACTN|nr:hypothetical protein C1706_02010 [Propioniciclava flava]
MSRRRRKKKWQPSFSRVFCDETGKRQYHDYGDATHVALRRSRYAALRTSGGGHWVSPPAARSIRSR